jgi:hypothetical protein
MHGAQIPRFGAIADHRAIVLFRVAHEARVLFRTKILVFGDLTMPACLLRGPPTQIHELGNHLILARLGPARGSRYPQQASQSSSR